MDSEDANDVVFIEELVVYEKDGVIAEDENKSNIDYASEEFWHESFSSSNEKVVKTSKRRKRKEPHEIDRSTWKPNVNKSNRVAGKKYHGSKKGEDIKKWMYDVPKEARELKPRCSCHNDSPTQCIQVPDDFRREIHSKFWHKDFSWSEKRSFVCQNVEIRDISRPRHRKTPETSRRSKTFLYGFDVNGVRIKVCKTFFLNTLSLKEWSVHNWKKQHIEIEISPQQYNYNENESNINYSSEELYDESLCSSYEEVMKTSKRRKRKEPHEIDRSTWKPNVNKSNRVAGKKYHGSKKDEDTKKWKYDVPKEARKLKPRCSCHNDSPTQCIQVPDDFRREIHSKFWHKDFSWSEKRSFVCQNVEIRDISRPRHRKNPETSRRSKTFLYGFNVNGVRIKVCKTFFLNTLSLKEWSVHNWKKQHIGNEVSPEQCSHECSITAQHRKKTKIFKERTNTDEVIDVLVDYA